MPYSDAYTRIPRQMFHLIVENQHLFFYQGSREFHRPVFRQGRAASGIVLAEPSAPKKTANKRIGLMPELRPL